MLLVPPLRSLKGRLPSGTHERTVHTWAGFDCAGQIKCRQLPEWIGTLGNDLTAISLSSDCMLKSSQGILGYGQGSSVSFLELGLHGITKPDRDPRLPRTTSSKAVDHVLS